MQPVLRMIQSSRPAVSLSARSSRTLKIVVRVSVVGAIFAATALVGLLAPEVEATEVMLATWLLPLIVLAIPRLGNLEYGVVAVLLAAGFVRVTLPTGTETDIVASLLVATVAVALWLVKMLVIDGRIQIKPAPTNVPLLGFMGTCLVSYVWSNVFRDILVTTWPTFPFVQLAALLVMVLLPAVFLLASNVIEDVQWLQRLAYIVVFIGTLTIIYLVFPIPVGKQAVLHLVGVAGVGMGLLSLWVVSITFSLALFDRKLPHWVRLFLLVVAALWMYFGTGQLMAWISIWLPPLCAMFVISFLRSKKLFLVMVILALAYLGADLDRFYQRVYVQSEQEGDLERLDLWRTNVELVENHLLFGTGPAGYAVYYMSYHPENARSTHNNYFDIVAQTGIVGLGMYIWFFAALAGLGYRLCRKLQGQRNFEEAFASGMMGGYVGAIVAMALGDWIVPFVYNVGLDGFDHAVYAWLLLGGMAALHQIVERRTPSEPGIATAA